MKSNLSKSLKLRFFRATVEAVLLYGCNTWTLTKTLANRLDGCYTKLLRVIHGVSWKNNINNKTLSALWHTIYLRIPNIHFIYVLPPVTCSTIYFKEQLQVYLITNKMRTQTRIGLISLNSGACLTSKICTNVK